MLMLNRLMFARSLEVLSLVSIQSNEDEDQDGEGPEGRTSVADKRQRDTDHRHKSDRHTYIDEQVHEDAAGDAVAVYSCEGLPAAFGVLDDPPYQEYIQKYHECTSGESPFLSDGTEDEVGTLLRYEAECGLCAV